jgi:hypothetical protein
MSDKEARVKLSLNTGDFVAKLQQALKQSAQASNELAQALGKVEGEAEKVKSKGSALGAAFGKAFGAIKADLTGIAGQLKSVGGMALSLGGAFSVGSALKGVVDLRSGFSELALRMELTSKGAVKWQDLQKSAQAAASLTTRSTDEMRESMAKVYSATGDKQFAVDSMVAIGTAATATGKSVEEVANIAQVLNRKFGATAKELPAMLERVFEKADSGGMTFEQLSGSLDEMAGAAQRAGLKGAGGLTLMLEATRQLDAKLGAGKAASGIQAIFDVFEQTPQKTRQLEDLLNVGNVEGLIDSSKRVKFGKDEGVVEKTRKILNKYTDVSGPLDGGAGKQGGTVVRQFKNMFSGDGQRALQAGLLDPFENAFKKARAEGKSLEQAKKLGIEAYDANIQKLSESTANGAKLQDAANAAANDPRRKFAQALQELNDAFASSPEVQSAIQDLAKALPGLAKEVGGWVKWAAKNPLEAVMAALAARVAMTGGSSLGASAADAALANLAKTAPTATAALGGLAAGMAIAAAAFAAYKLGESQIDKSFKSVEKMDEDIALADVANRPGASIEEKKKALEKAKETQKALKEGTWAERIEGGFGVLAGGAEGFLNNPLDPTSFGQGMGKGVVDVGKRQGDRRLRNDNTVAALDRAISDDERRRRDGMRTHDGDTSSTGGGADGKAAAAEQKAAGSAATRAAVAAERAAAAQERAAAAQERAAGAGGTNGLPGKGPTTPGTL